MENAAAVLNTVAMKTIADERIFIVIYIMFQRLNYDIMVLLRSRLFLTSINHQLQYFREMGNEIVLTIFELTSSFFYSGGDRCAVIQYDV